MAGYYKKIKGKDYDGKLIDAAQKAVKGHGDGRISLADAKKIIAIVRDSAAYTDIEKRTMSYIRDHFSFTPESNAWFRTEIRRWAAQKGATKKPSKPAVKKKAAAKPKARPAAKKKAAAPKAKARPAAKALPRPAVKKKAAPAKRPQAQKEAPTYQDRLAAVTREEPAPPASRDERPKAPKAAKKKSGWNIILFILLLAIIIVIVMVAQKRCGLNLGCSGDQAGKAPVSKERTIEPVTAEKEKIVEQETEQTVEKKAETAVPRKVLEKSDEYDIYTVGVKDSLISISEKNTGDYRNWAKIFNANRDIINNPTLIFPGQQIRIPKR